MVYSNYVGARVRRKEDPRLITGSSTYVGDVKLPGMLHCAILRSPYAHARINSIDASAALALPGVVAVFTGEQMKTMAGPMTGGGGEGGDIEGDVQEEEAEKQAGKESPEVQYPLAVGKVRHVGEQVAAVIATDMYTARDAVDLVEVDWEPLPVAATLEAAMAPDAPQLFGDKPGNVGLHWEKTSGDVDAAFAEAEKDGLVLDLHIVSQRLAAVPMEGRAVCAAWDAWQGDADGLELQSEPAQRPLDDRKCDRHVGVGRTSHRAGSRRRLRREDRCVPGRCHHLRHRARTEAARQVDRIARRKHAGDEPRARPEYPGAGCGA